MPLDTQAFLLRVLESGDFLRVGASKTQKTDVRVIAATNVSLLDRIQKGKFREDLYYRLSTVPIQVPALKDRPEDILLLFRKFSSDFAEKYHTTSIRLDEEAQHLLVNYRWRGNIRELKNLAEQVSVLSENKIISAADLIKFIPAIYQRNLPARTDGEDKSSGLQERDILYKLLFDMKKDLNDLKSLVFELIKHNDLRMPDLQQLRQLQAAPDFENYGRTSAFFEENLGAKYDRFAGENDASLAATKPVILDAGASGEAHEVIEENLSLTQMEKDLILKALRKHVGKRKEAADDLGISERTLYRKIKEYDL